MPTTTIFKAEICRLEILGVDGVVDDALMPDLADDVQVRLMELMVRMRIFDEKALNLQRQGRIGTFGSMRGQEAAQAGLVLAIREDDWLIPSIREQGVMEARGIPMYLYYAFCKGDSRSACFPQGINCLPQSIPIASQLQHAAGLGMALRLRQEDAAAIGFCGDGATSEGDFHEALNFAGVFRAKTLFYVQNNGWAISVPFAQQTAAESIAQKACAYGFPGVQVDGNDVFAVYAAASEALDHVRSGKGPYLIEALTYRMGSHTTADDASRYRDPEELNSWEKKDPLKRMRSYLGRRGLWDQGREQAYCEEVSAEAERQVALLEDLPPLPATDIFDYMYSELPPNLAEQRAELVAALERSA